MENTPKIILQLPEMADILDIEIAKAKNWTNGRTGLIIKPSIRESTGTGKSDLYSLEDLYLMALASEFSKAGVAAKAIGKLVEAIKSKFNSDGSIVPDDLADEGGWTVPPGRGPRQAAEGNPLDDVQRPGAGSGCR